MNEMTISPFGIVLLFIIAGVLLVMVALTVSKFIRPDRPNFEKLTSYECGEDALGTPWVSFNVRFYIIALIFVLFDVELVFLFPWAVVFGDKALIAETDGQWGWFVFFEMLIFIGILAFGLAYAWVKGYLDWVRPEVQQQTFTSKIPAELYQEFNRKQA